MELNVRHAPISAAPSRIDALTSNVSLKKMFHTFWNFLSSLEFDCSKAPFVFAKSSLRETELMSLSARIAPHLPFLRPFAPAPTGSQTTAAALVPAPLEAVIPDVGGFPPLSTVR